MTGLGVWIVELIPNRARPCPTLGGDVAAGAADRLLVLLTDKTTGCLSVVRRVELRSRGVACDLENVCFERVVSSRLFDDADCVTSPSFGIESSTRSL